MLNIIFNQCKRRRMQKKDIRKQDIKRPPSISLIIEPDTKPHSNGTVKSADFTISPPKQFLPASNSSVSSKDSTDSTKSLLPTKDTLSSSSCLVLPSITVNYDRRANAHSVIPTIYISSTCTSSSKA
ncbi:uncharacterized protein LOC129957563 isoform X2 [Argiope bruennichi]|uniref:uncharacterized protein LOC129957563 isoform X2 n=1 Tax=Argiope bruennichi TaxID=94029 RepID=UPI002494E842|nr:uncharacterized protein LOC129957563 isoform X2 [Argiope bruennichi]